MKKKYSLNQLFNMKSCAGWAWECKGRRHHYIWQNDNDLGLLCDIEECIYPETVQRRIKVAPRKYVYILRNKWGIGEDSPEAACTEPQLIASIRACHERGWKDIQPLTKHDQILSKRVFG